MNGLPHSDKIHQGKDPLEPHLSGMIPPRPMKPGLPDRLRLVRIGQTEPGEPKFPTRGQLVKIIPVTFHLAVPSQFKGLSVL